MLHVHGRVDDVEVIGGQNVVPGEVERLLESHPLVLEAAVSAARLPAGDTSLRAYVVAAPGAVDVDVHQVLNARGSGGSDGITAAIRNAARLARQNPRLKGKMILNGSLGGPPGVHFKPYNDACLEAESAGVLCLWSAGNHGSSKISAPSNWRHRRASIAFNRMNDRRASSRLGAVNHGTIVRCSGHMVKGTAPNGSTICTIIRSRAMLMRGSHSVPT